MTSKEQTIPVTTPIAPGRPTAAFLAPAGVTLVLILVNVGIGSVYFSPSQIRQAVLHPDAAATMGDIIWKIRIPRAIAAVLGGAYLAVSGLLLQVYFRNPIVGPFILGITHGATVMVSLVMLTSTPFCWVRIMPLPWGSRSAASGSSSFCAPAPWPA